MQTILLIAWIFAIWNGTALILTCVLAKLVYLSRFGMMRWVMNPSRMKQSARQSIVAIGKHLGLCVTSIAVILLIHLFA